MNFGLKKVYFLQQGWVSKNAPQEECTWWDATQGVRQRVAACGMKQHQRRMASALAATKTVQELSQPLRQH